MSGFIIAIDGPDGSGKTTQIKLLADALAEQGYKVHTTRANGGTPIGEELRKVSLSSAPRSAEVDLHISLALHIALATDLQARKQAGEIVIVDRSPLAMIAYQVFGSQLTDRQAGFDACEKMLRLWNLDMLLVFDIDQTELQNRQQQRRQAQPHETTNYFEVKDEAYKTRVYQGYKEAVRFLRSLKNLSTKVCTINASKTVDHVHQDVLRQLKEKLL